MAQKKQKGLNKRIEEIKNGTLYMAEKLGTERKLRVVFDKFDKTINNANILSEKDIRTFLFKIAVSAGVVHEYQEAIGYFDQLPKKRPNEQETRAGIMSYAMALGVPKEDVLAIYDKYDKLLAKATNEKERQQISYMGGAEVHRLLHNRKALVMDGKLIIPAEPGFEEDEDNSTFRKID